MAAVQPVVLFFKLFKRGHSVALNNSIYNKSKGPIYLYFPDGPSYTGTIINVENERRLLCPSHIKSTYIMILRL